MAAALSKDGGRTAAGCAFARKVYVEICRQGAADKDAVGGGGELSEQRPRARGAGKMESQTRRGGRASGVLQTRCSSAVLSQKGFPSRRNGLVRPRVDIRY